MNGRNRFVNSLLFKNVDRAPFTEWCGYWDETLHRWYCEGLPIGMSIEDYFGFDGGLIYPQGANLIPLDMLLIPRYPRRTLEEDDKYKIIVDDIGITKKILKSSSSPLGSMPQHTDWPLKNKKDFKKIKERFDPEDPRRIGVGWSDELIEYYNNQAETPIGLHIPGFYGTGRELMGTERLLVTFYKDPDLISEIFDFWADFIMKIIKKALPFKIDFAEIWEDMAHRKGPNLSPKFFRKYIFPHYKTIIDFLKKYSVKLFILDSDGNINPLIPQLIEAGVNCVFPLEVQSNMDVRTLRKEYGEDLALIGGIDKRALISGKAAIRREVEGKFQILSRGGYIPSIDHLVPPDVPFDNYKYYISLLKKSLSS